MNHDENQTLSMQQRGLLCNVCGGGINQAGADAGKCWLDCAKMAYEARRWRQYRRALETGLFDAPARVEYNSRRVRQYRLNLVRRAQKAFKAAYYRTSMQPQLWVVPTPEHVI